MATKVIGNKPSRKQHKLKTAKKLSTMRALSRPQNGCFSVTMGCPQFTRG